MDLNLYCIKGALALFVLVSGYVCLIKVILSFRVHVITLLSYHERKPKGNVKGVSQ